MCPWDTDDAPACISYKVINEHKYKTISTYPSSAFAFACLLEEENLKIPYVESIHMASEMLIDEWAEKIKSVLPNVKLKAHYGQIEKCSFFHQADDDRYLDNVDYGVTEFIEVGGTGKVLRGFVMRVDRRFPTSTI